jgi:hypothetical protein
MARQKRVDRENEKQMVSKTDCRRMVFAEAKVGE